jgi:hypothetical protein
MKVNKQTRRLDTSAVTAKWYGANPVAGGVRRFGFLKGQIRVPDDFDRMRSREIEEMFHGRG